jgi:hypothetical protein
VDKAKWIVKYCHPCHDEEVGTMHSGSDLGEGMNSVEKKTTMGMRGREDDAQ